MPKDNNTDWANMGELKLINYEQGMFGEDNTKVMETLVYLSLWK